MKDRPSKPTAGHTAADKNWEKQRQRNCLRGTVQGLPEAGRSCKSERILHSLKAPRDLSVSHAENPSAWYLSELRRKVSFSRCSPQSGLTSVPQEDGGTQPEISSGYTGRQLALGKQLNDQHN